MPQEASRNKEICPTARVPSAYPGYAGERHQELFSAAQEQTVAVPEEGREAD